MHGSRHSLPPLSAVRAFEAAARLGSFTRAAEELGMTQAAVSYQIKRLEERLGLMLFQRLPRKIVLTRDGERLAPSVRDAFNMLRTAFIQTVARSHNELAITSLPTIAANWLVPRLGSFQLAHPHVAVRLETSVALIDLEQGDFDIAIRSGIGDWPGHDAHFLLPNLFTPLCSPQLRDSIGGIESPTSLLKLPLLGRPRWWNQWFERAGVPGIDVTDRTAAGLGVEQYEVTAAIAGQGVAITSPLFFRQELASGRLVQPFELVARDARDYWFVCSSTRAKAATIRSFRAWIIEEAQRDLAASKYAMLAVPR
jgi:LysR family glycine cleavage system transcriptional activator